MGARGEHRDTGQQSCQQRRHDRSQGGHANGNAELRGEWLGGGKPHAHQWPLVDGIDYGCPEHYAADQPERMSVKTVTAPCNDGRDQRGESDHHRDELNDVLGDGQTPCAFAFGPLPCFWHEYVTSCARDFVAIDLD